MRINATSIANYISQISAQLALRGYGTDVAQLDHNDRFQEWNLILFVIPQDHSVPGKRIKFVLDVSSLNNLGTRADITIISAEFSGLLADEYKSQLNSAALDALFEELSYRDGDYYVDELSGEEYSNGFSIERVVNALVKAAEVPTLAEDAR